MSKRPTPVVARKRTPPNPNPEYEFLGPPGAVAMLIVLPLITYGLYYNCRAGFGCIPAYWDSKDGFWPSIGSDPTSYHKDLWDFFVSTWDVDAFKVYSAFMVFLFATYFVIPGKVVEGAVVGGVGGTPLTKDRSNYKLKYKVNALRTLMLMALMTAATLYTQGVKPFLFLYEHFIGLITASLVWTFGVSIFVYIWSFLPDGDGQEKILACGGNTGTKIYDFVLGRELNPRFSSSPDSTFDIKYFIELRPGLIGWIFLNFGMACQQYHTLGRITNSMVAVLFFETFYVVDSLWNESAVLTTMDITTDGFGFMLANGLLTWLPMNYSLQARFLADFPVDMSLTHALIVIATQCVGYYIFRSANGQKDNFRRYGADHPMNKGLKYMETKTGSKLLISGWWGTARHINYFGDWLMALAWSLPCGLSSPLPYFYPIYFAVLLIHRELRDEEKCHKKYGKDWDKYCETVRWRIIPYVY
ncbi:ERG4/ERG24 ergosterol biosynthesis protein [Linnemannia elongata]|nr:ERG4/ERG24 ergosterol biosynthesis protein [Linnemannia elongata]